jgi:competence protein ComEA
VISLTRVQLVLVLVPLLVLLGVAGSRLAGVGATQGPSAAGSLVRSDDGGASTATDTGAPRLVVHVVGAVRRPGLFRLQEGARVADAVERAGGPTRRADLSVVNLAAPLADGQQVIVPRRGPAGSASAAGSVAPGRKVSLAVATVEQLDELPGIGPITAQKIVDWRASHAPFGSVEDLDDVPGIGPARVEQLRDLVTP